MARETIRRGLFIVLEGLDRSGKSTQARQLSESLTQKGQPCKILHFPDRSTPIGQLIDDYLKRKVELNDQAIHLLFSANRWERKNQIIAWLDEGKHVICDRYSASGVAYSAAKLGLDIKWCMAAEEGLPKPDLILFLTLSVEESSRRGGYGEERYEVDDFQLRVRKVYQEIMDLQPNLWTKVDAGPDEKKVAHNILNFINEKLNS